MRSLEKLEGSSELPVGVGPGRRPAGYGPGQAVLKPWLILPCVPPAFLLWDPSKVPPRLQDVTDDHIRMHKILQESGLKYVAVMPPHIGECVGTQLQGYHQPAPSCPLSTFTGPSLAS